MEASDSEVLASFIIFCIKVQLNFIIFVMPATSRSEIFLIIAAAVR